MARARRRSRPAAAAPRRRPSCPTCRSRTARRRRGGWAGCRRSARCRGARRARPARRGRGRCARRPCRRRARPRGAAASRSAASTASASRPRCRTRTATSTRLAVSDVARAASRSIIAPTAVAVTTVRYGEPTCATTCRRAWGTAWRRTRRRAGMLDIWYPRPPRLGSGRCRRRRRARPTGHRRRPRRATASTSTSSRSTSLAEPPADAADAYLRLHLLSHRLVAPHEANLDGIFGLLANVAWTRSARCAAERVDERPAAGAARRPAARRCIGVDKFPRMADYVVPSGVRIADADRVRLGAHLAAGTTVMHEGFVNFNAGTLGTSMVEGRISRRRRRRRRLRHRRRRVDHGHAVRRRHRGRQRSASAACSAPTPASASRSATTASSRPAATSPPARR